MLSAFSFYRPIFLWGLAFLAVPILIHLLTRRKTVRLDFSSVRFLRVTAVKASARRNLTRLLLLLNRILIVIAVTLLFAQPYKKNDPFRALFAPRADVYVWIDPTLSMDYQGKNGALREQAYAAVRGLDSALSGGARLLRYEDAGGVFVDARAANADTDRNVRYGSSRIDEALHVFDTERMRGARRPSLIIMSDFQKSDLQPLRKGLQQRQLDFPVFLVDFSPDKPWNYTVAEAAYAGGANAAVHARIRASGRGLKHGEVSVISGTMRNGRQTAALEPDESLRIEIEIGGIERQTAAIVQLEAEDPFPYDNRDYVVIGAPARDRVLIISAGQESFPVAAALSARAEMNWGREPMVTPLDRLGYDQIDSAEAIVINGIAAPSSALQAALGGGAGGGKKAFVFAPAAPGGDLAWTKLVFDRLAAGGRLETVTLDQPVPIVLPDTVSQLWKGFPRLRDRDVNVYSYVRPIPGKPLLTMANGDAFVSHLIDQSGHSWLVFASPIGVTEANNFAETGFYVPALDRLLQYALRAIRREQTVWFAGKHYRNPFLGARRQARVFNQNKRVVTVWHNQPRVALDEPGVYTVQPEGGRPYLLVVTIDSLETQLEYETPIPSPENQRFVRYTNPEAFAAYAAHRDTASLSRFLWLALALLLLTETLVWGVVPRTRSAA